ncbi:MAG: hypothetical protein M1820_004173 [Bogoriella megaspora]|nr:MAG: hypothetical protein M1820_004173 [Bogoriella megaspora]
MGLTFCWWLTFEMGNIFLCNPVSFFWQGWDGEHKGRCLDANSFIYAGSGINISIDISIILLPLPEIFKLQLSAKKKAAIMAMFCVGGFTTIVACIRLAQLRHYAKTTNPTMDDVGPDVWTMLELNVGVFCVCMPAARKFLVRRFPTLFGSSVRSYGKYEDTPDVKAPNSDNSGSSKRSGGKTSISKLGGITKSVDTRVSTLAEDDEIELVQTGENGSNAAPAPADPNEAGKFKRSSKNDEQAIYEQKVYRQWR